MDRDKQEQRNALFQMLMHGSRLLTLASAIAWGSITQEWLGTGDCSALKFWTGLLLIPAYFVARSFEQAGLHKEYQRWWLLNTAGLVGIWLPLILGGAAMAWTIYFAVA